MNHFFSEGIWEKHVYSRTGSLQVPMEQDAGRKQNVLVRALQRTEATGYI